MYRENRNGSPGFVLFVFVLIFSFFVISATTENFITGSFFLLCITAFLGGICAFWLLNSLNGMFSFVIERQPLEFLFCIIALILDAECFLNYNIDLKPPEVREVEILDSRQWTTVSRSKNGGRTTHYHAKVYLKGWNEINKDRIELNIRYGTASNYKKGYYASIKIKTGLFNIKYVPKEEIKATDKCVDNLEDCEVAAYSRTATPKNSRFSNGNHSKAKNNYGTEAEEERIKRVFYDPKSPDFGKKKLPKEIYEKLSDEDKKLYKRVRKQIIEQRNANKRSSPALIGY